MLNLATARTTHPAGPPPWADLTSEPCGRLASSNTSQTSDLNATPWQAADSMHARSYNPMVGRFLSVDVGAAPPGTSKGWN